MGNFYVNYTLQGPSQKAAAEALAGRKAVVTREENGCIVIFEETSDEQDQEYIAELASDLSRELHCSALAVLNHDDDILWYQLYENGKRTDEYDSSPGYFDPSVDTSSPAGGDAWRLCAAFNTSDVPRVERVLRKVSYEEDGYIFAFERHADLVLALGLSAFAVGTSYASFENKQFPAGLSPEDVIRTR
jgi:hypothetical protein